MSGQKNSETGTDTDQDDSAPAGDGWVMGAWSPESFESAVTPAAPPEDADEAEVDQERVSDEPDGARPPEPAGAAAVGSSTVDPGSGAATPAEDADAAPASHPEGDSDAPTVATASGTEGGPAVGAPASGHPGEGPGGPRTVSGPPPQGGPSYAGGSQLGAPQLGAPQFGAPQFGGPQYGGPQYGAPQYGGPQYGAPQFGGSQFGGSQYGGPPPSGPQPGAPANGAPFGGPQADPPHAARTRPRPDAASAAELTEDAIVRHRSDRPTQGWRGGLFRLTGGLVNPGIGPIEKARQEQLRRIRRPLPGSHQIAVSSIKGGVGKTSVSACLGLVLAENRGDRVIALDANPDAGTLADRLTGETSVTVRHLLDNIEATHSLTDVARYTSLAGRLQVLASEQDPAMSEAFNRDEYERVCEVLTRFYNIVITDSGTGLVHSAMEGTLALADSLVVVGAPTVDGASRASKTLDWLIAHGHAAQVAHAIVVLSCDRTSKEVDRSRVRSHFEARCRAVVEIPHDPHLATGGRIELGRLRRDTHDAFLSLAAQLADGFGQHSRRVEPEPDEIPSLG